MTNTKKYNEQKVGEQKISIWYALLPLLFLITLLSVNVFYLGNKTLDGSNQIVLILSAAIAAILAIRTGMNWLKIRETIVKSIGSAMPSMLILLLIGSLAGTWLISGIVPAMIYYGLKILNAGIFLFASVIICTLVSLGTGSSWSTVATIGIALLGIGEILGFETGLVAGAIISGAYFGDKISPLSDTTNLAPAMAGTDLFTHIRYMLYTTIPSISITLIIFLIIGFTFDVRVTDSLIDENLAILEQTFNITPWLFIVPILLIAIIIKKVPPLPALLVGTILGGVFAVIFQPEIVKSIAAPEVEQVAKDYALSATDGSFIGKLNDLLGSSYVGVMKAMYGEVQIETGNPEFNELLSTGGMAGMLNTIWLILSAMIFGGTMEAAGFLKRITKSVIRFANSTASLVASTAATCIFFNITASDQYISIVVPGKMYAKSYQDKNLKPEVLSRTLEDSGTVTSVLIPWNTCGATQASVLGVATITYLPYAFFNLISPFMTILFAVFDIKIRKIKE